MSAAYFAELIELKQHRGIEGGRRHIVSTPVSDPKKRAQFIFILFKYHAEILFMRYSRGDNLQALKEYIVEVIEAWEIAYEAERNSFDKDEMAERKAFRRNLDFYVLCLWLISIAISLDVDDAIFNRLVQCCGNDGEDWLFEQLVSFRINGRKTADRLLYPKTYNLLKFAIQEKRLDERNRLLRGFVQRWYPSLSKTYWYDSHTGPDGGGYFGYWCFELAAAVKVFDLDDGVLRESLFYPKDLACYRGSVAMNRD